MGKINLQKVIVGGLIAGVVLNVIDYVVFNILLKDQMAAAMAALNRPPISGGQIGWFVFLDFVAGVFLVWLYAAVRPRFGAGPATATKAGVAAWFVGNLLVTGFMWPMAIWPHSVMVVTTLIGLAEWSLATVIGAKFYTEGAPTM
jgi:hypothetical protein